jgi:hypothetical protein
MYLMNRLVLSSAVAVGFSCSERAVSPITMTRNPAASAASAGAAICSAGVFSETTRQGDVDHSRTLGVMRLRTVEVDIAALRRSADTRTPLTLNIFPDACLVARVASVARDEQGRLTWNGTVADGGGDVTLVVADDIVIGSASDSRALYQLRYAGNGVHVVMQINPAAFPPD